MADNSFKFEFPLEILSNLHSYAESEAPVELVAEMHGYDGSKTEVTVVSEGQKSSLSLTFEGRESHGIHKLLANSWKCKIFSSKTQSDDVNRPEIEDQESSVVATTKQPSIEPSSRSKRGRPPKRRGKFQPQSTPKRRRSRNLSKEVEREKKEVETESTVDASEPSNDPDLDLELEVAPDCSGSSDNDSEAMLFDHVDEDRTEVVPKLPKEGEVMSKNSTVCPKEVIVKLTRTNVKGRVKFSGLRENTKSATMRKPRRKLEKNIDEIEKEVWTKVVGDAPNCRICDSTLETPVRDHITSVHNLNWANYQHAIYVIERVIKLRNWKRQQETEPDFMDPKLLSYSKKTALEALKTWRQEYAGNAANTSNQGNSSVPEADLEGESKEPKRIVINNKSFCPCPFCEKIFIRKMNLESHIRAVHNTSADSDVRSLRNIQVPLEANSKHKYMELYELNQEVGKRMGLVTDEHDLTKTVACLVCNKIITGMNSRNRLIKHLTEKHLLALDIYQELLKTTDQETRNEMITNILTDERKKKTEKKNHRYGRMDTKQCPACLQFYRNSQNLYTHVRKLHSKDENYDDIMRQVEEQCSATYRPTIQQRDNLQSTCPYCEAVRVGKSIVKHVRVVHNKEPDFQQELEKVEIAYAEKAKERESQRKMRADREQRLKGTIYTCKFCKKEFKCRTTCHRHMLHLCLENPNRTRMYYCKCNRRFKSAEVRDAHKVTCMKNEQDFQCHMCGKIYKTRSGLYCHKQIEHSDKNFRHVCPVCNKTFFQKHHFDRHIAVHTEDRKCQCELCGKQYKTDDAVKKHQAAVHENKYPYYCKLCGHGVSKMKYLKAHRCGNVRRVQVPGTPVTKPKKFPVRESKVSDVPGVEVKQQAKVASEDSAEIRTAVIMISPTVGMPIVESEHNIEQMQEAKIEQMQTVAPSSIEQMQEAKIEQMQTTVPSSIEQMQEAKIEQMQRTVPSSIEQMQEAKIEQMQTTVPSSIEQMQEAKIEQIQTVVTSATNEGSEVLYIPIIEGTSTAAAEAYPQVVGTFSQGSAQTSQNGSLYANMAGYQYYQALYEDSSGGYFVKSDDSSTTKQ